MIHYFPFLSLGAAGVWARGPSSLWWSSGECQPSSLSLPVSQHRFPETCKSSDSFAGWGYRYTNTKTLSIYHYYSLCLSIQFVIYIGHTVDKSCLHLLHGEPSAQTWTDITSQVSLYVTHLYAIFYITHFSWWDPVIMLITLSLYLWYPLNISFVPCCRYWLWYTTQQCVSGVVRKVYQRLKQFKVQFFVLQKKIDPSLVLLQCLPADKVNSFFFYIHFGLPIGWFLSILVVCCLCWGCPSSLTNNLKKMNILLRWTPECRLYLSNMMDPSLQICVTCWRGSSSLQALKED